MPQFRHTVFILCLALPWLNPFAPGPSPAMLPWLVSLACVGALLLAAPAARLPKVFALFFIAACAYFMLAWALKAYQNSVEVLATVLALACAMLCAMVGRGLHSQPVLHNGCNVQWLAGTWLVVALLSCAMALCQYFGVEPWFAPWISQAGDGTAFANLRQRNQFATLTGIGLLALVYLQTVAQTATAQAAARAPTQIPVTSPLQHVWPWAALLLLAAGNAATASRTGAVQWLLLAVLGGCWRSSLTTHARRLLLLAVPVYAAMAAVVPLLAALADQATGNLLTRMADTTGGGRVALYSNVWDLILQQPWLGWGWRELAYAHYAQHFDNRFPMILDNAHNLPLHLAVELGVPFALLVCGVLVWWVLRNQPWREVQPQRQLAWGVLLLIGVHSLTEYPLWYGPFLMTAGLCVGLLCGPLKLPNKALASVSIALATLFLIAFTSYAGWDYYRVSQIYLAPEARNAAYADNTLAKAQGSWLFGRQARFAELVTTPVTRQTAPRVLALAADLVHYSPEPRIIQALIESSTALHLDDVAMFHLARFKDVFPQDYAAWSAPVKPAP